MKAAVIGGGSWGSAFAFYLGGRRIRTKLWVREDDILCGLLKSRMNRIFLPGIIFPPSVSFFNDIEAAMDGADVVFVAVPSAFCRSVYMMMGPRLTARQTVVSLTKGLEARSHKRMTQVMAEVFAPYADSPLAVLSGPSFAREVAEGHPTALVLASERPDIARRIQGALSSLTMRVYTSRDVAGVEAAGALKNTIAIAAGISDGLDFGFNSRAALITRGLVEMTRLGVALGGRTETFFGLAGVGDLVLTCTAELSRNHTVGFELGRGKRLEAILSRMTMVAEGVKTTRSVVRLARRLGVEMPIADQVHEVLYRGKPPRQALADLMLRKLKDE